MNLGFQLLRNKKLGMISEQESQLSRILFLRRIIRNSQSYNKVQQFGKFGIGVIKYEIAPNLKKLYQFKIASSIKYTTNLKVSYMIEKKEFQTDCLNQKKEGFSKISIEQVQDNTLLLSGGKSKKEFIFCSKGKQDQELQMQFSRHFHRTSFNKIDKIAIISGGVIMSQYYQDIPQCEVFDIASKKFRDASYIKIPLCYFGCDQINKKLFTFGGFSTTQNSEKNEIQTLDFNRNQ